MKQNLSISRLLVAVACMWTMALAANAEGNDATGKIVNGHKFVDLGLPSGLLWAETNVGAAAATEDGDYFAWGETSTQSYYDWSTYKLGSSSTRIEKYNNKDCKFILEAEDDAATANWGSPCRMPSKQEIEELCNFNYCTWKWTYKTTAAGTLINGFEVISKANGNSIFLPAVGYRNGDRVYTHGSRGYYWSSSRYASFKSMAYSLYFGSGDYDWYRYRRYFSFSVRAVVEP